MYKLLLVAVALLLSSCGDNGCVAGKVGNTTTICKLHIVEVQPKEIKGFCGAGTACWDEKLNRIVIRKIFGESHHEVFRDLGEETWHAMGGDHK